MPRSGFMAAHNHWCLHDDALAQQYDAILKLSGIYTGCAKIPEGATFYAPLRVNTKDAFGVPDTFSRASPAWYRDSGGVYRQNGVDQARFQNGRILIERAGTNKATNFSHAPDAALSNVRLGGSGSLSRIDVSQELEAIGLGVIGNGYAVRVTAATGDTFCTVNGQAGNTQRHTISGWCKKLNPGTGTAFLRASPGEYTIPIVNADWLHLAVSGESASNAEWQILAQDNADILWVGSQYEEYPILSSPIVSEGTAGQRASSNLTWTPILNGALNQAQGMLMVDWNPQFDKSDLSIATSNRPLIQFASSPLNAVYYDLNVIKTYDEVNTTSVALPEFAKGEDIRVILRWGPAGQIEYQLGNYHNGSWDWGPAVNYDGSFTTDDILRLNNHVNSWPSEFSNLTLFNENKGQAWIENNLTP